MNKERLRYSVAISSVDGQTTHIFDTNSKGECLQFLERYDHEGSSISFRVYLDDASEIYGVLGGDSV